MVWLVASVFLIVYVGMIVGRIPGLALDRTGVALLGSIVLLAFGVVHASDLLSAIDVGTVALLFGLMILSAQFRMAGAYSYVVGRLSGHEYSPRGLLALLTLIAAILSALLINDIVCLAMTPMVIEICAERRLNPVPYLLAVACASNIGSAATIVGNPQNILIGQTLDLSFAHYLLDSLVPVTLSLILLHLIIGYQYRDRWAVPASTTTVEVPRFDLWQTAKGGIVAVILLAVFLADLFPRELAALAIAGILLCSRKMRSREILGIVDWQLLVLFISLFIVNFALRDSSLFQAAEQWLQSAGIPIKHPAWLFGAGAVLSNIVSNVPAVMLLLPLAKHSLSGPVLALSSTLAGNFLIVGSIANIIVVEQAARLGVKIHWTQHAKSGIPVTVVSLLVAGLWLWLRA
jgi:Na+/H+ antiporter NhaD/arsenite permease-like protein